ncbi:MAG: alpha-L-glutamate ligase-like protein [Bdellovibrionales bacterium]|nr:alpha-L-glutamate ligase-like protein [Bdellovibrionales bacterium]
MEFFSLIHSLRDQGILGMNRRNLAYVSEYNARKDYPKADDKLITKALAIEHGIAVPQLYKTFQCTGELQTLQKSLSDFDTFVLKPAHGSGGEGVLVVDGRDGDYYLRGRHKILQYQDIRDHCAEILHGLYSLGGRPDSIIVEERVEFDPLFEHLTEGGVPDIRLIVYRGVPLMGMLRLPTLKSQGRANLHQGAIGVGIQIAQGHTLGGVHGNHLIDTHPDTGYPLVDIQLPQWETLLNIATSCYDFSGLGYLGVDIVYDRKYGPLLLEINARPGLAIQLANQQGLLHRIRQVDTFLSHGEPSKEDRLAFVQSSLSA